MSCLVRALGRGRAAPTLDQSLAESGDASDLSDGDSALSQGGDGVLLLVDGQGQEG